MVKRSGWGEALAEVLSLRAGLRPAGTGARRSKRRSWRSTPRLVLETTPFAMPKAQTASLVRGCSSAAAETGW